MIVTLLKPYTQQARLGTQQAEQLIRKTNALTKEAAETARAATAIIRDTNCFTKVTKSTAAP